MDFNKVALECIQSDYIKKYLDKSKHKFSYIEQITIILNSNIGLWNKKDTLEKYMEDDSVKEYLGDKYIKEIKGIIDEIRLIYEYIQGKDGYALVYKGETFLYCGSNYKIIEDNIRDSYCKVDNITVDIYNMNTGLPVGSVTFNDGKAVEYTTDTEPDYVIKSNFVNIPNDLVIGDIVTSVYSDEKFVVVKDNTVNKQFIPELVYDDNCIVVIPIGLLQQDRSFSKQIEGIYVTRINNIENPYAKPDIIMENYSTINIIDVEKQ